MTARDGEILPVTTAKEEISRPVYGTRPRIFGRMIAGVQFEGPEQARLLRKALEDALKTHAGRHEETFFALKLREINDTIRRAKEENWGGWEEHEGELPPR